MHLLDNAVLKVSVSAENSNLVVGVMYKHIFVAVVLEIELSFKIKYQGRIKPGNKEAIVPTPVIQGL